jgi:hypothetical protein
MFIASATASGDQFSYQEVNNSGAKPKPMAAGPPPVEVFGNWFTSGGAETW